MLSYCLTSASASSAYRSVPLTRSDAIFSHPSPRRISPKMTTPRSPDSRSPTGHLLDRIARQSNLILGAGRVYLRPLPNRREEAPFFSCWFGTASRECCAAGGAHVRQPAFAPEDPYRRQATAIRAHRAAVARRRCSRFLSGGRLSGAGGS